VIRAAGKTIAAAAVLAALLLGLPAVLVIAAGWPLPRAVPTWPQVEALLTGPGLPDSLLIDSLACLGWICWALLTLSAVVEVAATVANVPTPRLPALSPAQALVAGLIAALTLAPLLSRPGEPTAARRAATHSITDLTGIPPVDADLAGHITLLVGDVTYTYDVQPGDTLWDIARAWLGDPHRWPEIYRLNAGRHFPAAGGTLTDPDLIYPGWHLALPEEAHPPGTGNGTRAGTGASFGTRAGTGTSTGTGSRTGAAPATPPPTSRPHAPTTGEQDNIPPTPQQTTPRTRPPRETSTSLSAPGTTASTPASTPTEGDVETPVTRPASPPASASSASSVQPAVDVQPARAQRAPTDGVDVPGGWIGLAFASALALAATAAWQRRRRHYRTESIPLDLPGYSDTATGPDAGADLDGDADFDGDDDLPPLPSVVLAARQHVRRQAAEPVQHRTDAVLRQTVRAHRAPPPSMPASRPDGAAPAGLPVPLPDGPLGLDGPGAHAAARALLVATLTSGRPGDPHAQGEVLIDVPTLNALLGQPADDEPRWASLRDIPGLTVTKTLADALTRVELELIARRRLLLDADVTDLATYRRQPENEPVPRTVLIADNPDAPLGDRITAAGRLGAALGVTTVIVGTCLGGATLNVAADGHIHPAIAAPELHLAPADHGTDRLAVLDAVATLDVLRTLAPPPTGQGPPPVDASGTPETPSTARTTTAPAPSADIHPASGASPGSSPAVAAATGTPRRDQARSTTPVTSPTPRATAQVLGSPVILNREGNPVDSVREAALELLTYLAVHRDGASLDDVKEALYGDATRDRARQRLSTDVANLRGRIRHASSSRDGEQGAGVKADDPVVNSGGRYHLHPDLLDIDWWRVQDAAALAKKATTPADQAAALEEALTHYHGPLADDRDYEWATRAREHTRRLGVAIHTRLAALITGSDPARAAQLLETACDLDPYHEETAQLAMRAHARVGDRDAVKTCLRRLRTALNELDETPDDRTEALAQQCLGPAGQGVMTTSARRPAHLPRSARE
jgi:DNA-binding SARP family transcriptional activator